MAHQRSTNIQNLIYALLATAAGSLLYGQIWLALGLGAAGGILWYANRRDEEDRE